MYACRRHTCTCLLGQLGQRRCCHLLQWWCCHSKAWQALKRIDAGWTVQDRQLERTCVSIWLRWKEGGHWLIDVYAFQPGEHEAAEELEEVEEELGHEVLGPGHETLEVEHDEVEVEVELEREEAECLAALGAWKSPQRECPLDKLELADSEKPCLLQRDIKLAPR